MAGKGYLIGEEFAGKLRTTVSRVLGDVSESQTLALGLRFEDGGGAKPVKNVRIGTFLPPWPIGGIKEVTLKANTASTFAVENLFFDIPASTAATYTQKVNCAIAKDGTAWYLIDVPIQQTTSMIVTEIEVVKIPVLSTVTVTLVSDVTTGAITCVTDVSASLNTSNCTITVSKQTTSVTVITGAKVTTFSALVVTEQLQKKVIAAVDVMKYVKFKVES